MEFELVMLGVAEKRVDPNLHEVDLPYGQFPDVAPSLFLG
jgi:hypothetical protein